MFETIDASFPHPLDLISVREIDGMSGLGLFAVTPPLPTLF